MYCVRIISYNNYNINTPKNQFVNSAKILTAFCSICTKVAPDTENSAGQRAENTVIGGTRARKKAFFRVVFFVILLIFMRGYDKMYNVIKWG